VQITVNRTEPATGGPARTPRERIEPVFADNDLVEPDAAIDFSSSLGWPGSSADTPGAPAAWDVQMEAFRQWLAAAETLDSQAKSEQGGGSDEKGGVYSTGFNHENVVIGSGDDDGDLNSTNMARKLAAIRVRNQDGTLVPLPYGGTNIMPAIRYLDEHYLDEFAKDEDSGTDVPVARRPKRARTVWTDGGPKDFRQFGERLKEDHSDRWPQEEWFIAIFGFGPDHDATVILYNEIAEKHANVHVYSFDSVTNPAEIAEDMALAVLATR
jgi:hypothetical protein